MRKHLFRNSFWNTFGGIFEKPPRISQKNFPYFSIWFILRNVFGEIPLRISPEFSSRSYHGVLPGILRCCSRFFLNESPRIILQDFFGCLSWDVCEFYRFWTSSNISKTVTINILHGVLSVCFPGFFVSSCFRVCLLWWSWGFSKIFFHNYSQCSL